MTEAAWVELTIRGVPRDRLAPLCDRLFALGATGLQEAWLPGQAPPPPQPWDPVPHPAPQPDPVLLSAWFPAPERSRVERDLGPLPWPARWTDVPDTDWDAAYRASVAPIRVGDLVIAPPWNAPEGALILEPGHGFGTGSHPTTLQALGAVVAWAPEATDVLDVGSGSGILALAAARLAGAPSRVLGIDVDADAVAEAQRHAAADGSVATFSTAPLGEVGGGWDLVLANLHAELLIALAPELRRVGTHRWALAGILADREAGVRTAYAELPLVHREQDGEWVHLRYEVSR